jgi:hypothetical protein
MIQDRAAIADGGALQLVIEDDAWDSFISFAAGIPVQLGGTLELTFADNVDVSTQLGRTLRLFNWTGVSPIGRFDVYSPYLWDVTKLYTTGEVTLVAVPEPTAARHLIMGISGCALALANIRTTRFLRRRLMPVVGS